jgi:hypothetical protein
VHGEDLIVSRQVEEIAVGKGELIAHQQRQNTAEHEKQHGRADVEEPDVKVVDFGDEAQAFGRLPGRPEAIELVGWPGQRIGQLAANEVLARGLQVLGPLHCRFFK